MSKRKGPNKENLEETRNAFLQKAKIEFVEAGYSEASTSRIVEASGMARGSLYYHFGDKYGLFHAVYECMVEKSSHYVFDAMAGHKEDPKESFYAGCDAFLELCLDPEFRKIVLIEAQAAIDYVERIKIMEKTLIGRLNSVLATIFSKTPFQGHTPRTAAVFVIGMISEAGRSLEFSEQPEVDKKHYSKALRSTIDALITQAA